MSSVLIYRKVAKEVEFIFEHPDKVYSVYLKAGGDVVWLQSEIELYEFLRNL